VYHYDTDLVIISTRNSQFSFGAKRRRWEAVFVKRFSRIRSGSFIPAVLILLLLLSSCASEAPRLPATFNYSPGAVFTTNINDEDPRRVLRCAVVFLVIDEAATTELVEYNAVIRNAVLVVLGGLTVEELTTNRDLGDIAQKMVDQVNQDIGSRIDLVVGAYFTDIVLS